jgi:beta-glucanase (GH16 family)
MNAVLTRIPGLVVLLLACSAAATDSTLVWSDEFDGSGLPDSSKWDYDVGGSGMGNQEAQLYTRARLSNAHREGGNLVISALREDTGTCWYGPCRFTSARLLTKGRADWLYGRVDVRAQLSAGVGTWPAIWMLPTNSAYGGWPDGGEIDIMENVGYSPTQDYATLHFSGNGQAQGVATSSTLSTAFHLYSLVWRPDSLFIQFDGATIFRYGNTGDWHTWPFDQKFFLILNQAVGGQWGGQQGVDTANWGRKDFLVDYVRVWKYVQGTGPFVLGTRSQGHGTVARDPDQPTYPALSKVVLTATPAAGWEFFGWSGALAGSRNPDTLAITGNDTATAVFLPVGERIANGSFDPGLQGWVWWNDASVGGSASLVDGEACLSPGAAGASIWMAQWKWIGLDFVAGETYDLSFTAHASRDRPLQVGLVQDHDPFGSLATAWSTTVGVSRRSFTHRFQVSTTDAQGRLEFDFGTDTSTLCLDSVSLRRATSSVDGKRPKVAIAPRWSLEIALQARLETSTALRDLLGRRDARGSGVVVRTPVPGD